MYRGIGIVVAVLLLILLLAFSTPFDRVLREDALNFVIKGFEIANGDLSLLRTQGLGWPIALGLAYLVLDVDSLFAGMYTTRWLSILLVALSVIPVAYVCRRLVGTYNSDGAVLTVIAAFAITPLIHFAGRHGMSEALFLFLTISSVAPLLREKVGYGHIALAAALAGCAFYVKPNALFILVAMVATLLFRGTGGERYKHALGLVLVFAGVTLPYLLARYNAFGSPFDYGANSRILVDSYEQVWASNVPHPTWLEYLQNRGWQDFYDKFVDQGLFKVFKYYLDWLVLPVWSNLAILALVVYPFCTRYRNLTLLFLVLLVSLIGMAGVFHIFGGRRHLIYLIPFIYAIVACFLARLDQNTRFKFSNIPLAALLVVSVALPSWPMWFGFQFLGIPEVRDDWALWAAENLQGKVAIVEGGDVLQMSQHYAFTNGDRAIRPFREVDPYLTPVRPGIFDGMGEALENFEKEEIRYVVTDYNHIKRRPFLKDIEHPEWQGRFSELKSFNNPRKGAVLGGVKIYRIHYPSEQYFPPRAEAGGWRKNTAPGFVRFVGLNPDKVQQFGEYNLSIKNSGHMKGYDYGLYKGALVIKNGWIVGEWYNRPDAKDYRTYLSSVGKTVAMMLFGVLIKDGQEGKIPYQLSVDSRVYDPRWLPEGFPLSDDAKSDITFKHVFQHTSGLTPQKTPEDRVIEKGRYIWTDHDSWVVGKDPQWPQTSMLYFPPGRALEYEHRETWGAHTGAYSSVAFAHLGMVFRNIYNMPAHDFLEQRILDPLGISGVGFHRPPSEQTKWFTAGDLLLTTRYFGRFAYFVLSNGNWEGQQLVPADWIPFLASTPNYDNFRSNVDGYFGDQYPPDMVRIYGSGVNLAFVIPSHDLIVIRTGRVSNFYMNTIQRTFLELTFDMLLD